MFGLDFRHVLLQEDADCFEVGACRAASQHAAFVPISALALEPMSKKILANNGYVLDVDGGVRNQPEKRHPREIQVYIHMLLLHCAGKCTDQFEMMVSEAHSSVLWTDDFPSRHITRRLFQLA